MTAFSFTPSSSRHEATSALRLGWLSVFSILVIVLSVCSPALALLVNQETGEGYRPTINEEGELEDPPDWVPDYTTPVDNTWVPTNTVTIQGNVFYNDRRSDGLFSVRKTPAGVPGTRCNPDGLRDDGTPCRENWLGAQYMVVDIIERDEGYFAPTAWDCKHEDILASVAVNANGSFSATFTPTDPCDSDRLDQPAIVLKVRLRYCGEWCFSVNSSANTPYALYHPGASPSNPRLVTAGDTVTMTDLRFNPAGIDPGDASDHAIAANYYASLVDTVLTLHRDNGIPFYKDEFGEVQVLYPSTRTGSATALSPTEIALIQRSDWVKGEVVAHEYGHVVMMRAWDGDYGWDGVGNGGVSWNVTNPTEPRIAFKEGWANFISRAVFVETRAYDAPAFDDNASTPLPGALGVGWQFVTNVNKLLSDWYDARADAGDHFTANLYSIWYNLRRMYLDAGAYGGDFQGGLTICDYVNYYLDVRKSAAAVGAATHEAYVNSITDLIYNNNIACFLPAPQ